MSKADYEREARAREQFEQIVDQFGIANLLEWMATWHQLEAIHVGRTHPAARDAMLRKNRILTQAHENWVSD